MKFTKMHGLGNDYIYVNCFEEKITDPPEVARRISCRHKGIGGDGLILICPSEKADAKMRIFNADGSEAEMCGNGIRCLAKYVYDHNLASSRGQFFLPDKSKTFADSLNIETGRCISTVGLQTNAKNLVEQVCVNMGPPILIGSQIPVDIDSDRVVDMPIDIPGFNLPMTCVSIGNPHAVFFTSDIQSIELEKIGPIIENHKIFPKRTNVHFVQVNLPDNMTIRTWERGSGITLACGTGACACCVAGVLTNKTNHSTLARLPGGSLEISWSDIDNCLYMTGPAVEVFTGTWQDG